MSSSGLLELHFCMLYQDFFLRLAYTTFLPTSFPRIKATCTYHLSLLCTVSTCSYILISSFVILFTHFDISAVCLFFILFSIHALTAVT
jgi:hypothetical protein